MIALAVANSAAASKPRRSAARINARSDAVPRGTASRSIPCSSPSTNRPSSAVPSTALLERIAQDADVLGAQVELRDGAQPLRARPMALEIRVEHRGPGIADAGPRA